MKKLLLVFFLVPGVALGAFTEFYCQTTGSNLNAGSTATDAATQTYVSAVVAGGWNSATGVFTVASGAPSTDGVAVGNFASIYVTSGATVATFVARVTAVSTTTITVSLTAVSGTPPATDALGATTCKIGGAWKGPNAAVGFPFGFIAAATTDSSSNPPRVNFKGGTNYAITAAITHSLIGPVTFQGYTTTAGDGGKATIDGGTSGASYTLLTANGVSGSYVDFIIQNNGATGSAAGLNLAAQRCLVKRIVVNSVRGIGFSAGTTNTMLIEDEAYSCNQSNTASSPAFLINANGAVAINCIAHDNAGSNTAGFQIGLSGFAFNCISDTNGAQGFLITTAGLGGAFSCDAYNNGSDGFAANSASTVTITIQSCNAVKNGGWGINFSGSATNHIFVVTNCGFGSGTQANTSGTVTGITDTNSVTYASGVTPWTDPANGDFRINLAAAKGKGWGAFTETAASYAGTIAYPDIGASQHLDSGGSYTFGN